MKTEAEETWRNTPPSEYPSIEWIRKLLREVKKDSAGSCANVRKRFIRAFAKEDVVASNGKWQIKKASKALRGSKANGETWRNVSPINCPTTYAMRRLLNLYGKRCSGSDDVVRKRFKWLFARDNVVFFGDRWKIQNMWCPNEPPEDHDPKEAGVVNQDPNEVSLETLTPEFDEPVEVYGDNPDDIATDLDSDNPMDSIKVASASSMNSPRDVASFSENEQAVDGHCDEGPINAICEPSKTDRAIHLVYKRLYAPNKDLDHNGASTYAEITRSGVSQIIEQIRNVFFPFLTKDEIDEFRAVDLGGGFLTCLAHIAQVIPGQYIGIEYDAGRAWLFAVSYQKLLKEHFGELCNTKIAYLHMDILEMDSYECDLVYTFDEAFPKALWLKIVKTFRASPRCKFLIMFKVAKSFPDCKAWNEELLMLGGVTLVGKLALSKKGGETSNAAFFVKNEILNRDLNRSGGHNEVPETFPSVWEECHHFWSCKEIALQAVSQLRNNLSSHLEVEKGRRKR